MPKNSVFALASTQASTTASKLSSVAISLQKAIKIGNSRWQCIEMHYNSREYRGTGWCRGATVANAIRAELSFLEFEHRNAGFSF